VAPSGEALIKPSAEQSRDTAAMNTAQRQIAIWSGICLFINLLVVILGFAVFKRSVGPFAVSNFFTLAAFLIGTVIFAHTSKHTRMVFAKLYFVFLYALMAIGTPLALYYTCTIPSRVDDFCANDAQGCDDSKKASLRAWGIAMGTIGTVVWYFIFSFFPRHVFVYMVATERSHLSDDPAVIPGWIRFMVRFLPNWHYAMRRMNGAWIDCKQSCGSTNKSHQCTFDCHPRCPNTPSVCSGRSFNQCVALCCCLSCVVILVLAVILCETVKSVGWRAFWCIVAEIILIFFQAVATSSDN